MYSKVTLFLQKKIKNDFWRKLLKNVVIVFTGNSFSSAINMFSLFFILLILNKDDYGMFTISQNYMFLIDALANFQSWQGVIRYGSFAIENKNEEQLCATIKMGLFIDIATCFLGAAIGIFLTDTIANVFAWNEITKTLCYIFCLEIIFHIEGAITGILRLFDKFKYTIYHSVFCSVVKLVVILLYFFTGGSNIVVFTCIYVVTDIVKYIIYLGVGMYALHVKLGIRKTFNSSLKKVNAEHFRYTIWSNLTSTFDVPIKYFDVFFLSLISNSVVASYKIYQQVVALLGVMIVPISQVIMPQLSELIAKNNNQEAYRKVMELKRVLLKILIPFSIAAMVASTIVFRYFKSGDYYEHIYILYMLLIMNIFTFSYVGIHPLFSAYGYSKLNAFITLGTNILYIILAVLCVQFMGITGIILAAFIQFLATILLKQYFIKKLIGKTGDT